MTEIPISDSVAPLRLSFRGGSMHGTFRNGDCLWVQAIPFDALRLGDVVAYHEDEKTVAHRIVGRVSSGWLTQGDGNRRPDRRVLRADRLVGRVSAFERRGVLLPVEGGAAGLRRARWLHVRARMRLLAYGLLAPPYRLLRASRLVRLFWRPRFLKLRLRSENGDCIKYLHRQRTVARLTPGTEDPWSCRKPYDLVLHP